MSKVKLSGKQTVTNKVLVKWVKKANQYCETTFDDKGKQTLRWFSKDAQGKEIVV